MKFAQDKIMINQPAGVGASCAGNQFAMIPLYNSPYGDPTCCLDFHDKQFCPFLGSRMFGTIDVCLANNTVLLRDKNGTGWIRPSDACALRNNYTISELKK